MIQKKLFLIIAMLCLIVRGAKAQASLEQVYAMTQTTAANWTPLNSGSTTGQTLGTAGTTTYYYADANLMFTNSNAGGSALTIVGLVYLYVPEGVTVTCTGANADGVHGAGAGIELPAGNTLYLFGGGTVNATGGNAAGGGNGEKGKDASCKWDDMEWAWVGGGGFGGNGGGGAGAGIGTRGGTGGAGGSAPASEVYYTTWTENGVPGSAGSDGQTAGDMGALCVFEGITVKAKGGSQGWRGTGGAAGISCLRYGGREYSIPGGGGGGGGGFGGAASDIGTGGPGGGGGGGGAKGSHDRVSSGFYIIFANGGHGGENGDHSSWAYKGEDAGVTTQNVLNGLCQTNDYDWVADHDRGSESSDVNTHTSGGNGGEAGDASRRGTVSHMTSWPTVGEGTAAKPFLISSAEEWDAFARYVCSGTHFKGRYVQLAADISVSVMVGAGEDRSFQGTFVGSGHTLTFTMGSSYEDFDEEYCAPFRYVNGAAIRDLKVVGSIYTCRKFASGLVARSFGTTTITGCQVGNDILSSNLPGEGSHGGIVAATTGTLTMAGCVYEGRMLADKGTTGCAGFVGWHNGATINISNSLFAPGSGGTDLKWKRVADCVPFVRGATTTITNCYHTKSMGHEQGKSCFPTTTQPVNLGALVQDYGVLKAYRNGILYYDTYYVGSGTESDPYNITSAGDWDRLALYLNEGGENLKGKYVRLKADISVSEMLGSSETNSFQGIFIGDGHTLTFTKGTPQDFFSEEGCAPFRYVKDATIRDLKVSGVTYPSRKYAAGLVARSSGTTTITNCQVCVEIFSGNDGEASYGGIVGCPQEGSTLSIEGCAYYGRLLVGSSWGGNNRGGGFVGWHNNAAISIANSLFAPRSTNPGRPVIPGAAFVQGGSPTITNCYYTETLGGPQGTPCYAVATQPDNLGSLVKDYGMLKAYQNGIFSDGTYYTVPVTLDGSGTEDDPYLIGTATEWISFAKYVNSGISYSGKYVKLNADVDATDMVGALEANSFRGTFLGDGHTLNFTKGSPSEPYGDEYCAPFRYVCDAAIRGLRVTGHIYTSRKFAGGLVAGCYGKTDITDCQVGTVIHSTVDGEGSHGGIVARSHQRAALYIGGCMYDGRLLTNSGTHSCGGFVGWHERWVNADGTRTHISNSLYAPGSDIPAGWTDIRRGSTFARGDMNNHSINNCYYTEPMGAIQGMPCFPATTRPANLGDLVADFGMLKAYQNGISRNGMYYVAATMAGSGTESDPYLIGSADQWDYFARNVANGVANYKGQYVTLGQDISVSMMVGSSERNSFQGIFIGGGHTLTFTKGSATEAFDEGFCAPFRYVCDATIRDLRVKGDIYTSGSYAAGLVGRSVGTTNITNCIVSTVIFVRSGFGAHGGIAASVVNNAVNIAGCVFDGRLLTNDGTHSCGGFMGNDLGNIRIVNSLYAPGSSIPSGWTLTKSSYTFVGGNHTITNCFYTEAMGNPQGTLAGKSNTAPAFIGDLVQDYGMVQAYQNGIVYDGTYFAAPINGLADNGSNSEAIGMANGYTADVRLLDRTLYKDNSWNTICLPFNMRLAGSPLAGAVARPLTEAGISGTTLNLTFGDPVDELVAGTPYIVKWNATDQQCIMNPADDVLASLGFISEVPTFDGGQDTNWSPDEGPEKLVDGNTATKYGLSQESPWVEFHYASPITPKGYALWTANDSNGGRNPLRWIIRAKNSGDADWTQLVYILNLGDKLPMANNQCAVFALNNNKAYQYFRFEANISMEFQLAELQFCTTRPFISADHIHNPMFRGVVIDDTDRSYDNGEIGEKRVRFVGTYDSMAFRSKDYSVLLMGDGNTLYYPAAGAGIGAQRAYLRIGDDGAQVKQLTAFRINFSDGQSGISEHGDETAIKEIVNGRSAQSDASYLKKSSNSKSDWYTLDGRRLDGEPLRAGVYVNGGKKVVIK